jgi:ABC-type branched-subunit amino acid transport system ATPase component
VSVLLEVADVNVHFGGVRAVDGIDFDLETGCLYGLVGPNGSGKSTLLGALSRMTNLTSGRLVFAGEEYQTYSPAKTARMGIGRTFQAVRLIPGLSVLENVMLGGDARTAGVGIFANWLLPWRTRNCERSCREGAMEAIERLELTGLEKRTAGMLPYGTQRRVEIARALAAKPDLLLFDEPTAGMNREERDEVGEVMRSLRGQGLTQVLVEHDMQMITEVCDYVFVMNFGKVIAQGDPEAVVADPLVQEAYLGKRGSKNATA